MYRTMTRSSVLSRSNYLSLIALSTCVAGVFLGLGAIITADMVPSLYHILLFAFFALCSIVLIFVTRNAVVSAIGVASMMVSLGCVMGPVVALYTAPSVLVAVVIAAVSMVIMSILGLVYQRLFLGMGPFLLAGLTLLIVAQFTQIIFMLMGFTGAADMPVFAWIGIVIFLGFTAYDWADALQQEFTADNAVKASAGIGLNLANLVGDFLELVGIKSPDTAGSLRTMAEVIDGD